MTGVQTCALPISKGKFRVLVLSMLSSSWRRTLRHALARSVCAGFRRMWKWETDAEFAMRDEVKYSLTEKCENCTTLPSRTLTIETNVEQAESINDSGSSGRQPILNPGVNSSLGRIAKTSASSSTRSGRTDITRHWNNRLA